MRLISIIAFSLVASLLFASCGKEEKTNSVNLVKCQEKVISPTDPEGFNCIVAEVERAMQGKGNAGLIAAAVDKEANKAGGKVVSICHIAMHKVGRDFANENKVTLQTLANYLPPSNSSNCAAGFTHGMVSVIGIDENSSRQLLTVCAKEETRSQQFSCAHGIGHGLRRTVSNDEYMRKALKVCDSLGPKVASDCAQGVFHDFYLAAQKLDEENKPPNVSQIDSLCEKQKAKFQAECWYRRLMSLTTKIPAGYSQTDELGNTKLICEATKGQERLACIKAAATKFIYAGRMVDLCSKLKADEARACISGSYLLAPSDENKTPSARILRIRNRDLANQIVQCVNMPGAKAQEECVYWMAYRAVRVSSNILTEKETDQVCAQMYGKLGSICEKGLNKARSNDLSYKAT